MHTRREFLATLLGAASLAGCAGSRFFPKSTSAVTPDGRLTQYPFGRQDIDALQIPCLGVTLGGLNPGVMFLTRYEKQGGQRWESPNHFSIVTRGGRIVATHGLRRDISATRFGSEDPLLETSLDAWRLTRHLDLAPGDHQDVRYESRFERAGEEFLTILERSYRTRRVIEWFEVKRWQWQARNTYWIEVNSGAVIRSVQHIAPDSPWIAMDLLKAPA